MTRFFLSYHSRLGYRVNVPNFEGGHCITVDEHDAELASLRQRIAELEAQDAQPVTLTPHSCVDCKRGAERMREAAAMMAAGIWNLKSIDGEDYEHVVTNHIADCIRALPLDCCDCNPLAPEA